MSETRSSRPTLCSNFAVTQCSSGRKSEWCKLSSSRDVQDEAGEKASHDEAPGKLLVRKMHIIISLKIERADIKTDIAVSRI